MTRPGWTLIIKCRKCSDCLNGDKLNAVSLKEEAEQFVIDSCVEVKTETKEIVAKLPLLADPAVSLGNNENQARRIYDQQVYKLNRNPKDRDDVLKSEMKMQKRGHVIAVHDLPADLREVVKKSRWSNFFHGELSGTETV